MTDRPEVHPSSADSIEGQVQQGIRVSARATWQIGILCSLSLVFYAVVGSPTLVGLLLLTAGITFATAKGVAGAPGRKGRLLWILGIGWSLALLATLKLAPAVLSSAALPGWLREVVLPASTIGVSYWVLQTVGYLTDVRRGQAAPERSPIAIALSLAFFPKVLQGPIERCQRLIPQFSRPLSFVYEDARHGLILVALGLLKKLVIADRLAPIVSGAFASPESHQGLPLLLALYAFSFQIYFDFSGYTDIALGTARVFGIRLTDNFNRPYWSSSIPEFWRRWHITLSNWLRDYLFAPMLFKLDRRLQPRLAPAVSDRICYGVAAVTTMSICGLWHGPKLTFLLWGALHGFLLVGSTLTRKARNRTWRRLPPRLQGLRNPLAVLVTFHLVSFSWVLFRADGLDDAWRVLTSLPGGLGGIAAWGVASAYVAPLVLAGWLAIESMMTKDQLVERLLRSPLVVRWAAYYAVVLAVLLLQATQAQSEFIYFRF